MKLALLQCNVLAGEIAANVRKVADFCSLYPADLYITPLSAILGPIATQDANLIREVEEALHALTDQLPKGRYLVIGNALGIGCLLHDGKVRILRDSFRLNGYDIAIGLDAWASAKINLIFSLEPRPFFPGSQNEWELILSGVARTSGCRCFSVNLVGGYGQKVYNGQSVCAMDDGNIVGRAKAFAEDCLLLDLENPGATRLEAPLVNEQEEQWQALVLGTRDFVRKKGAQLAILGLSGGMDSALVACIAKEALGSANVFGILMPSPYTSPESIKDAEELASNLRISTYTVPLTPMFASFRAALKPVFDKVHALPANLTEENLQARIRGVILMAISNQTGALVLNTSNLSESMIGYSTLHGDTVGAIGVIGDLFKTRVYELAHWYCARSGRQIIPQNIFDKPPSAELAPGQKDTDSLPPYPELDPLLAQVASGIADTPELQALKRRVESSAFKRKFSPPPLLVGKTWQNHCGS